MSKLEPGIYPVERTLDGIDAPASTSRTDTPAYGGFGDADDTLSPFRA